MNSEIESVNYLEKVKQYRKQYYINNKDKLKSSSMSYYENNKDHRKERMKEYREENKKILNEKKTEKIQCSCGAFITRSNLATHKKSNKHIKVHPT